MSAIPAGRRAAARRPAAPRLHVVPPPRRRHRLAVVALVLLTAAAAVFATVTVNALSAADAVRAAELERSVAESERRYRALVAEVAALEDPRRIERVAIDQLGMVPASGARYLLLERPLPRGVEPPPAVTRTATGDPLKPVLSVQR